MSNVENFTQLIAVAPEFNNLFLTLARLEMRCRSEEAVQRGLEARIADPLWMLARQWQMGEFIGEDNGSPSRIEVEYKVDSLKSLVLGRSGAALDVGSCPPLETIVEREPACDNIHTRIRTGQQFERFLLRAFSGRADSAQANALICLYRKKDYMGITLPEDPSTVDYETNRLLHLMEGRAIDGKKLLDKYIQNDLPALPAGFDIDGVKLQKAFTDLEQWYTALYSRPGEDEKTAWKANELDYEFSLSTAPAAAAAGGQPSTKITAADYRNGDLDWYSCDLESVPAAGIGGELKKITVTPTHVGFAGKPNERWWTFEDYNVNLARLNPGKDELCKFMLIQFALTYADDWYYFPLELPVGSVAKLNSLTVYNVFGEVVEIDPVFERGTAETESWELFTLAGGNGTDADKNRFLFIPPTPGDREESGPVEEVRFIRDEQANMVFAIEHTVQNGRGKPVDGFEAQIEAHDRRKKHDLEELLTQLKNIEALLQDPALTEAEKQNYSTEIREIERKIAVLKGETNEGAERESDVPQYRLAGTVPENWIPFIPLNAKNSGLPGTNKFSVRLRQAQMIRNEDDDQPAEIKPMTRIIGGSKLDPPLLWLNEESVPRSGVKVVLTRQRARWIDGRTYVWLGRKVTSGRGEGSSGLRFDYLRE